MPSVVGIAAWATALALQSAIELDRLGRLDDARAAPRLETALDARLERRAGIPAGQVPEELDSELAAALGALHRLDPEAAVRFARRVLRGGADDRVSWAARRVIAAEGEIDVVRQGLREYFADPSGWSDVLARAADATSDPRLRDFRFVAPAPEGPSRRLLETRVLRALGRSEDFGPFTARTSTDSSRSLRRPAERDDAALATAPLSPGEGGGGSSLPPGAGAFASSTLDRESVVRALDAMKDAPGPVRPEALVLLVHLERAHPDAFLDWMARAEGAMLERARYAMSLSGNPDRLPLLVDLAVRETASESSRRAAFRGLAEQPLGIFDKRLHRLAGDPDRAVRLHTALALAPTGDDWALRLLFAEVDESHPIERRRARLSLARAPTRAVRRTAAAMVDDSTATPLAVEWLLAHAPRSSSAVAMWRVLEPFVAAGDLRAAEIAAGLDVVDARRAIAALADSF